MYPSGSAYPHQGFYCSGHEKSMGAEAGLSKREKLIISLAGNTLKADEDDEEKLRIWAQNVIRAADILIEELNAE